MATSSPAIAALVLRAAHLAYPRAALLHGASRLESDSISDIDLVVSDASRTATALVDELRKLDLEVVMVWPYDINSVTLLIASRMLRDGAQLDVLDDVGGLGKYGVRTDAVLSQRSLGHVSPVDSWLYSVQKRIAKGQVDRALTLAANAPTDMDQVKIRAFEILRFPEPVIRFLETGKFEVSRTRPTGVGLKAERLIRRLYRPTGWAVHADDCDVADRLEERLARFVPHVQRVTDARTSGLASQRTRWRAGVVVSCGGQSVVGSYRLRATNGVESQLEAVRQWASIRASKHLSRLRWNTTAGQHRQAARR